MRVLFTFLKLYRPYSARMGLGILLTLATLLASIGLLTLSGWFLAASCLAGLAGFLSFNYVYPAAGVRGAAMIRTAGRYAERLVSHDTTFRVLANLRSYIFAKLLPLAPSGLQQFRRAELLNSLVADVDTLDHLYLRLINPMISGIVAIGCIGLFLTIFNTTIAWVLAAILLVLLLLLPLVFYFLSRSEGESITERRHEYRVQLTTLLESQAELMIFNGLNQHRQQLNDTEENWLRLQQNKSAQEALSQGLLVLLTGLTLTLTFVLSAYFVDSFSYRSFVALFVFAALGMFEILVPVPQAFLHLGQLIASATRVKHIITQQPNVVFANTATPVAEFETLTLQQINFSYLNNKPTLQNISLTLQRSQHIALLGKTGCGKSTLLQLLTRAFDPTSGHILINERPLNSLSESNLRQLISVVPQRCYLFSGTLRDNLRLAQPNASDAALLGILQDTGLEKLLEGEGLNAWLGEGGRALSGGEQRRLGIARALLHDAPLVLLDEPTEGLDEVNERKILNLIRQKCHNKALITVTHRLTDLEHYDAIYVMEHGTIVEHGTHQALMQQQQLYWEYHQSKLFNLDD